MKKLYILFTLLLIQSCSISRIDNRVFKTKIVMYLYDVKYDKNEAYPYSLWDIKIVGEDELHRKIAVVPPNTILHIEKSRRIRSFSDIDVERMYGYFEISAKKYYFESSWSDQEIRDYLHELN